MIKKVKEAHKVPLFFAPFYYDHMRREAWCAPIGLNILFYFLIELYWAIVDLFYKCRSRK